jgi:hypothetical protein
MPKYEVVFTRTITESTTIIGYADDLEQAKDAALEILWSLESADWEVDDVPRWRGLCHERRGGGLMRYVVETRMGDVWEAVWSEDQEPMTFDSEEEAEVEIAETLEDLQEAYELGDMSSPMTRDEFRIVAL